jgi:hypothetical protein
MNFHCDIPTFNVRANIVGMKAICGLGSAPTADTLTSFGPDAPVDQMKSWTLKLDGSPECDLSITYTASTAGKGFAYLTGSCPGVTENIQEVHVVSAAPNGSEIFPILPASAMAQFPASAPFSFVIDCDDAQCRAGLCGSVAGSPYQFRVELVTVTDKSYYGDINVANGGGCPAITVKAKAAASSLSFTVYLTVLLALFSKWLF